MKIAFSNCFVIDCVQPEPIANATVVVDNGIITSVLSGAGTVPDAKLLDLKGAYLLPGLWECHCHLGSTYPEYFHAFETEAERTLRALRNSQSVLQYGVTAIRVVGEANFIDVALREAYANQPSIYQTHISPLHKEMLRKYPIYGPRMFVAGPEIRTTGGTASQRRAPSYWGHVEADGPDEVRKATRHNIKMGVDWIKLGITGGLAGVHEGPGEILMTFEEITAACDAAHCRGVRVTAHLGSAEATKLGVNAGLDCVEHGYQLDQEVIDMMAKNDVFYVPTLTVTQEMHEWAEHTPEYTLDRALESAKTHVRGFKMALEAGVKIANGSDQNISQGTSVCEVEMMARSGMSNWQALVAATRTSAELCDAAEKLGTIEEGKTADLIVVAANPLDDISNLRKLQLVVKEGAIIVDKRSESTSYNQKF